MESESFTSSNLPSIFRFLIRGVSSYNAKQIASSKVDLPDPVFPEIKNTSLSTNGAASKSTVASSIEAMLCNVSCFNFIGHSLIPPAPPLEAGSRSL